MVAAGACRGHPPADPCPCDRRDPPACGPRRHRPGAHRRGRRGAEGQRQHGPGRPGLVAELPRPPGACRAGRRRRRTGPWRMTRWAAAPLDPVGLWNSPLAGEHPGERSDGAAHHAVVGVRDPGADGTPPTPPRVHAIAAGEHLPQPYAVAGEATPRPASVWLVAVAPVVPGAGWAEVEQAPEAVGRAPAPAQDVGAAVRQAAVEVEHVDRVLPRVVVRVRGALVRGATAGRVDLEEA